MSPIEQLVPPASELPDRSIRSFVPIVSGVFAISLTFIISTTGTGGWRYPALAAVAAGFVAACLISSRSPKSEDVLRPAEAPAEAARVPGVDVDERLTDLEEASEVFATSLSAADMFRLVSSRVNEIFPFDACALVLPDVQANVLRFVHADGPNSEALRGVEIALADGLAGSARLRGEIEIDNTLSADAKALGGERLDGFSASVAVPIGDDHSGCIFQMFLSDPVKNGEETMKVLDTIRDHVSPIFQSSLAFERSISNALTDALTGLPNERAFRMVLDNQLAESIRYRDERPLSVLTIDIRDFGAVNSMLGHAVGDRMLEFAAARIGESLRRMDFLARTVNDEFAVILPTASEKVAFEIVQRIRSTFEQHEFEIADGETVVVALNVGWSTFWKDGETGDQLVRTAHQRKRQEKCEGPAGVLWFPREYVN